MPSRKQKRRDAKSKRHEYEFVYVDGEGRELDEVPDDLFVDKPARAERRNGSKATTAAKSSAQTRGRREPQPPSWRRSVKRAGMLGAIVFVLFSLTGKGSQRYVAALLFTVMYTIIFIPFTYAIDRFAYRRYQMRQSGTTAKPKPAKKR